MTWAIPGVVQSGSHATGAWMEEFGAWYYDLARGSEGNFRHQGPPQMKGDNTRNWDATGAYLLAYAMPLKKLVLTCKNTTQVPQLNAEEAYAVVMDGRGWNNKDRNSAYEKLPTEILFENLGSWSPVIRKRSADALAKRRDEVRIEALVRMLNSPNLNTSYGACEALATLGGRATDAVPDLIKTLEHEDLWLRVKAAEALASIGGPAMEALPKLLHTLAKGPTSEDPRGMEQRYLSFTVFGKMLRKSIEGVNKDLLRRAVVAGLQNQDGHARSAVSGVYQKLNYEEIKPILPAIHEAVVTPAPSGIMFADGIRIAGLNLLAKHRIKEGIPLCLDVMDLQRWGKKGRIKSCLDALAKYGGAAKSELPRLREIEKELRSHRESKNLIPFAERTKQLIEIIETSKDTVELRSL
jgi:hypothetical protein